MLSPEELFRTYELGVQELKGKTPVYAAGLGAAKVPVDMSITGHWLDSMERGGRGLLSPDPNVAPRLSRAVFTAFQSGDKKGAAEAFERLKTLSAVLGKHHNPKSQKAALSILGRNGGYLRKPYLPIDDAARKEIAAVLDQLEVRKTEGLE